jgi:hypothetical protein
LTALERLQVLVRLEILTSSFEGPLTATIELAALDALEAMGRLDDLEREIKKISGGVTNGA